MKNTPTFSTKSLRIGRALPESWWPLYTPNGFGRTAGWVIMKKLKERKHAAVSFFEKAYRP
jgi:hypothetical protein